MTTTTSKLPTESKPYKMDPDLARYLEAELEPYTGDALKRAQQAVVRLRTKGIQGTWDELTAAYREAIVTAAKKESR